PAGRAYSRAAPPRAGRAPPPRPCPSFSPGARDGSRRASRAPARYRHPIRRRRRSPAGPARAAAPPPRRRWRRGCSRARLRTGARSCAAFEEDAAGGVDARAVVVAEAQPAGVALELQRELGAGEDDRLALEIVDGL